MPIQAGIKYDLRKNGAVHQLRIHNLLPEDSGKYLCDTGDAQCEVTLTVQGTPKIIAIYIENWALIGTKKYPVWLHRQRHVVSNLYVSFCQHLQVMSYFTNLPGAPVFFQKELKNQETIEGDDITLHCEVSKPGVRVEWRKGGIVLRPSKKYEIKQEGCIQELCIHNLESEDSGYYTCDAGEQLTTASLAVKGSVHCCSFYVCLDCVMSVWYNVILFGFSNQYSADNEYV